MSLNPTDVMTLRDGRRLEFALAGDPHGIPVVFFHGFIGSHHQGMLAHEAAARHGLRLILPNRPGVGRSTMRPRQFIADCAGDVTQLLAALGIGTFGVLGVSGGGPYALACLARLPERVRLAVVVSGLGPVGEPGLLGRMNPLGRTALQMGRRWPWLVRLFFAQRLKMFQRDPEAFLESFIRRWSRSDRDLLARPNVRRAFLADLREVLIHGEGPRGLVRELQLYFRWGFRWKDLPRQARVMFWHGRGDVLVPPFMAGYMARHLPGAELEFRPGGHFMVVNHADEVVQRTRALLG
jgi:pimeloyl-ACP methyl ester carboxylesterase